MDTRKVRRRRLSVFDLPEVDSSAIVSQRKRSSSVYQGPLPGPRQASQMGRLSSQLQLQDWERYGWHRPMERARLRNMSIFLTRSKTYLDGETNPKSSLLPLSTSPSKRAPVFLSLPALPTNGRGDPMLRRPNIVQAEPVSEKGDIFMMLTKGKELKPFSFMGDDLKTTEFYRTHYPLLLGKLSEHVEPEPASNKGITEKQVRERLRQTTAERRLVKMRQRMNVSEKQLLELERDNDGDKMTTELRDMIFNPMLWPWNLRRYRLLAQAIESKGN